MADVHLETAARTGESGAERRVRLRSSILTGHERLAADFSAPLLRHVFRDTERFVHNAAVSRDSSEPISDADRRLLGYCAAANFFRGSLPGRWFDDAWLVRTMLMRAGQTVAEENKIIDTLRTAYIQPGVLLPPEAMHPAYERNLSPQARQHTLDGTERFFRNFHRLPVDETKWPVVAQPFYEAAIAEE